MGSILCGGAILRHVTKMFCSPNRSAHGLHGRKTVRVRAKINEHRTVLVNSTDPHEKDPDSASFRADLHGSTRNGEAKYTKKLVSWDQRIPCGSVQNTRGRVKYEVLYPTALPTCISYLVDIPLLCSILGDYWSWLGWFPIREEGGVVCNVSF